MANMSILFFREVKKSQIKGNTANETTITIRKIKTTLLTVVLLLFIFIVFAPAPFMGAGAISSSTLMNYIIRNIHVLGSGDFVSSSFQCPFVTLSTVLKGLCSCLFPHYGSVDFLLHDVQ